MFGRMIDDFKDSSGAALRLTSLAAAAALALFVTTSFLCAAAFVFVLQKYGLIEACLTGAGIFFVVTLIAAGCYMARKNKAKARVEENAKSAVIRAIGIKKLIPILAVGGLALGFLASRNSTPDEAPAE
jgi:hypothetical protein